MRVASRSSALVQYVVPLVLLLTAIAGCDSQTGPPTVSEPPPTQPSPDTAVSPGVVTVTLGAPGIVLDYSRAACEAFDVPDVYAHAVRAPDGILILVSGNAPRNFWSFGSGFNSLARSCRPVLVSGDDPTAQSFDNHEWITSVYREGNVIHALVHNEYHDPVASNCKIGDTSPANPCWYNAITYAFSTDGGRSFQQPAGPLHVVAAPPQRWDASTLRGAPGPYGYFEPSNIIRGPDSAYYSVFFAIPFKDQQTNRGTCLMRTETLAQPSSWRAWDGIGFNIRMGSPYGSGDDRRACVFIAPQQIGDLRGSLTYNTYLKRYLLVGASAESGPGGTSRCGFFFALSPDLIRWSKAQLLRQGALPFPPCQGGTAGAGSDVYPSLIDHADETINFERTGRTPHLYYVRWNRGLDRDLIRVPVTFELR
ncbi:MAG: hypothetical protein HY704_15835 [Gemmatimonadetes bacterium]|nr:hypothetical protein [Gemmatimonadota bacterium]